MKSVGHLLVTRVVPVLGFDGANVIKSEVDDIVWYNVRWNLWMFIYNQELDSR